MIEQFVYRGGLKVALPDKAELASTAGRRGVAAAPKPNEDVADAYRAQTGCRELTPRQARRLRKRGGLDSMLPIPLPEGTTTHVTFDTLPVGD